jgi:hypothetical protein
MPLETIPTVPTFSGPLPTGADLVNYEANSRRYMSEAPGVIAGMNAAVDGINQIAVAAQQGAALIQFKGPWNSLTGALARPASVIWDGELWALLEDLAAVQDHEPSEASTKWALIRESAERVAYGATTVEAALDAHAAEIAHILPRLDNVIINGNFLVNQAALTSPVTLAAGARAHSCWKAGPFGATYSWSTVDGVTTLNITAGSIVQVIDGTDMPGGHHTAAWVGTAVGRFNAAAYGTAGLATANLPAGTNATLELSAGTVALVSMAPGQVARPYPWRRLAEERALCEYRLPSIISNGETNIANGTITSAGNGYVVVNLKETPRAHPTGLVLVGGAVGSLTVTSGVTSAALTGLTFLGANDTRIALGVTWSGGPSSVGAAIYINTSTTPTRLLFTGAEL